MFRTPTDADVSATYAAARDAYAQIGLDAEAALERALAVPLSVHCWQADDVAGLESAGEGVDSGGILATGGHPGRARTGDEMRADLEAVLGLVPGAHRLNLHALYAETGGRPVARDALEPAHFGRWTDWAVERELGLDFNPTFFSHPLAADGLTLAHPDAAVRDFWVGHALACRRIGEAMARATGSPAVVNVWIPDGMKDLPADRWGPRARLVASLDRVFDERAGVDRALCLDSVESKLFGLGSEAYVVGSFEFYLSYSLARGVMLCLDMGHFHPSETVDDKLSAVLTFQDRLLLHLSRPVRWDSDHVAILNDELRSVMLELARGRALDRALLAMDFFDASINRVAAYVIGLRAARQAVLAALLDPTDALQELEAAGHGAERLALMEQMKTMPFGAVWDALCLRAGVPAAGAWVAEVRRYEREVLSARGGGRRLGERTRPCR